MFCNHQNTLNMGDCNLGPTYATLATNHTPIPIFCSSSSNPHAVLRLTHDPTNSPNVAPRSTHDLCQIATDALGINTRSHNKPGML